MKEPLQQTGRAGGRLRAAVLLLAGGIACAFPAGYARGDQRLFTAANGSPGKIDEAMRPRIMRHRLVEVNLRLLTPESPVPANGPAATRRIVLNLFDDAVFQVVLTRVEVRSPADFTWYGRLDGIDTSQVTLAVNDGVMAGNVRTGRAEYQVRYSGKGTHVVYQIDPSAFPRDAAPEVPPGSGK